MQNRIKQIWLCFEELVSWYVRPLMNGYSISVRRYFDSLELYLIQFSLSTVELFKVSVSQIPKYSSPECGEW